MHQQPRALDVREEVVAEPGAVGGALDQARDVGEHELAVVGVDRAEHGLQRRERVRGDLRLRAGQAREQRGLAGVRQPDEPDVGEQLQLQLDPPSSPGSPFSASRGAWRIGGGEVLVARARPSRRGPADLLAGAHEVEAAAVPALARACPAGRARSSGSPSAPWRSAP